MRGVPQLRIRAVNDKPVDRERDYVLYWMIAARRVRWNFAFDRAIEWVRELGKPLVLFEPLRCGYQWASVRLHRFVLDGMRENQDRLAEHNVLYYPYVEPHAGAGHGLLAALAARACVVVTDEFPAFFLPRMVAAAAQELPICCETVDSCGLLPLRATERTFPTAYAFRRFLQKELPSHLDAFPAANPLARVKLPAPPKIAAKIRSRWPEATSKLLSGDNVTLAALPIDQTVGAAPFAGGSGAAEKTFKRFLNSTLRQYPDERNEPAADGTSGLSPYLHFGHISAHEIFHRIAAAESWSKDSLATKTAGKRSGWWGMSEAAEAFLDQLVTWRELGFNMCATCDDYDRYESLPAWALATLAKHERDRRPTVYSLAEFESARTHDPLWNAAQRQLLSEGRLHNYLRMLWGKKILEWSASPQEALATMIELNNKYAVDGRDPNSYSGIFWILGRYDRAWGPERPIFGTVRYMSSKNTARKLNVRPYLARYGDEPVD